MSEGIQTYEVGIVFGSGLNPSLFPIEEREGKISKNEMECRASMANHMHKILDIHCLECQHCQQAKIDSKMCTVTRLGIVFGIGIVFSMKMQIAHFCRNVSADL